MTLRFQLTAVWILFAVTLPLAAQQVSQQVLTGAEAGLPFSFAELTDKVRPSLVVIRGRGRDGKQDRMGTGFVVSASGLIATNLHVIGEGRDFSLETAAGESLQVVAVEASDHSLDLALIRVALNADLPLPALKLRETQVAQGAPVLAMGNPWGLEKSVVSGLVSAIRKVDGRDVIQLAMPIEPGNSGSPVVDLNGEVVGVVHMKSAVDQNIAFAIQVASLRRLMERPNPVAADHWFHLGTLDPAEWTPLFGSRWRQRGGGLVVSESGDGFGGRSLCLHEKETPAIPFEIAVSVKLDNESGAAGLVFHSDGKHRHYGFYPSNGRLRLSCFRGPTVFSWQVLRDEPSSFYRAGEWNELRVRVATDRLRCFVNQELVFESTDVSFTKGQVGLAKFRDTVAEFRNFRVASHLDGDSLQPDFGRATAAVDRLTNVVDVPQEQVETLVNAAAASQQLLRARARRLELQARQLQQEATQVRILATDVHVQHVARQIGQLVHGENEIDLLRGALLIAHIENEELALEAYVKRIDAMAREIQASLQSDASEADRLAAVKQFLFKQRGYHGSRFDYQHRANSYLNRVIDDREGLPITLCVLVMEVGKRLGLKIEGVGLPGHFVVRFVPRDGEPVLIDAFDGGKELTREDAAEIVRTRGYRLTEAHLRPTSSRDVLMRMLNNLYQIAESESDRESMLRFLEPMVAIDPDSVQYRGLRAVVRRSTGRSAAAIADLDWILEREPEGVDLDEIRGMREAFSRQ